MSAHIKTVVVFCGSSDGSDPAITQQAEDLGRLLGQNGYDLIYGGGNTGLMGVIAKAASENGSQVKGIIPKIFHKAGDASQGSLAGTDEHVVENMLVRKDQMILEADAGIALPGGYGTLDEIYEMAVVQELKMYAAPDELIQPLLVINYDGFYDGIIAHHQVMQDKGFLRPGRNEIVTFVADAAEAIDTLNRVNQFGLVKARDFTPQP